MSLGVPGKIISFTDEAAVVDFWGTEQRVNLGALGDSLAAGDYVLVHAGYVVRKIDEELVNDTLAMYEIILCEAGEDPISSEMIEELVAEE